MSRNINKNMLKCVKIVEIFVVFDVYFIILGGVSMKKISLLALAMLVLFVGCGKKKAEKVSDNSTESTKVADNSDIPVLSQDSENLVDGDGVSDFAFVDDDSEDANKKLSDASVKDGSPVATAQQEYALVDNDSSNEEDETVNAVPFKSINFELNKNSIKHDQIASLEKDCELAKDILKQGKKVVVQGHCCQLGSYSYNMALSQRRADIIKKEMVQRGIAENEIKTVGFGNELPLVWSSKTDRASLVKELAPNRRAEIVVN